jgi:hypothetical protein
MTTSVSFNEHTHDGADEPGPGHHHPHSHGSAGLEPDGVSALESVQHHGPSFDGSVVLDIGGDIGAVALMVPAALAGVEIDIIGVGPGTVTTHSLVRPRVLPGTTLYAAVYPGLPQGAYRIPAAAGFPSLDVQVCGGAVAEVSWTEC